MEKCLPRSPEASLLNIQYRMHQTIMGFSNQYFYENRLQADHSVAARCLPAGDKRPLLFIDTAGCGFEEQINPAFQSRFNPDEFRILREHLYFFADAFVTQDAEFGLKLETVALHHRFRVMSGFFDQGDA